MISPVIRWRNKVLISVSSPNADGAGRDAGPDWTGLDRTGLDRTGPDWTGLCSTSKGGGRW
eukprot:796914-Pyramimonas_sp.AAC.1